MRKKGLLIVAAFIGVILVGSAGFSAPARNPTSQKTAQEDQAKSILGIGVFEVTPVGTLYQAVFALYDENRDLVASDGHVKFIIYTENGKELLYQQEFDVKSNEFKVYRNTKSGDILGFSWSFDASEVKKPKDASDASAYIEVTLPGGKAVSAARTHIPVK